ncbi:MAG: hypothetical protein OEZ38_07400 [Gammaproteobacteria bacterium]|nr:hypothetical protein [Gammaproteobacteria bacterium]
MRISKLVLYGLFLVHSSILNAEAKLFVEGGFHFGGENLLDVVYVGGGSDSIEAGGLISGAIGFVSDINESFNLRTSFGIKFDSITATNGDADFTRFPFEAMLVTNNGIEELNFGMGFTYHLSPELSVNLPSLTGSVDFNDAFGMVAEIDYQLSERAYLGFKVTFIDYETEIASISVDGNSFGVVIGTSF